MRRGTRSFARLLGVLSVVAAPSLALAEPPAAQAQAVVLGAVSDEGDDVFANELTSGLRSAIDESPHFTLDARELTLPQMMLAHGCAEPDGSCMGKVAATLGATHIFFATLVGSGGTPPIMDVKVQLFTAASGLIERTVEDKVPSTREGHDSLADRTIRYVADLSGFGSEGTLEVRSNIPGAHVRVGERDAGVTDADGRLTVPLEAGTYKVTVFADGHAAIEQTVSVIAHSGATIEAFLQRSSNGGDPAEASASTGGDLDWLGWSLVGLGAAGVGLTVASSIVISGLDDDASFSEYRSKVPKGKDACSEADKGEEYGLGAEFSDVTSVCDQASLFEALWWVGLGVGVAATSAGVLVLLTGGDDAERSESASLRLVPHVTATSGSLSAHLRF